MVIPKKKDKVKLTFAQLEAESKQEIGVVKCKQQKLYSAMLAANNSAAFYFSVIFERQEERDAWCKAHGVILKDGEYVLAKDYNISMEKKVRP